MKGRGIPLRPALLMGLILLPLFPPPVPSLPPQQTAILEYRLGETESRVTLSAGGRIWTAGLPGQEKIEQSVAGFIREAGRMTGNRACLDGAAVRIAGELIPFRREMAGVEATRLIVIPDGILERLPFEALRLGGDSGSAFLAERYILSFRPSRGAPAAGDGRKTRRGAGLLAFGFDDPLRHRIPSVVEEVRRLSRSFSRSGQNVFLERTAGEAEFRDCQGRNYEVVHIAAHRRSGRGASDNAALVLLPGGGEDGELHPDEIRRAGIGAELVVLSACFSDRLARVFLDSGARSVLSTLWPVADHPTDEFMASFYSSLRSGRTKAEALIEAKRVMIRGGRSHPFFWAGFVLRGEQDGVISFR